MRAKPEKLMQEENAVTGEKIKNPNAPVDKEDQPSDAQRDTPESEKSNPN